MATGQKTLVVVGATGAQGGGLVRAALADPQKPFRVRALTRNPASDKAKELAALGAEVVKADMDKPASLEKAFAGAYGAYCVTNFWEHFSPEKELQQAHNMAEAAQHANLQHVIWSTLEDTRLQIPLDDDRMPTLMGNYKVPHFDAKGEADAEFRDRDLPVTLLLTSFYWENFLQPGMAPQRGRDGSLALVLPMNNKALPAIAAADVGKCAYGIFCAGSTYIDDTVGIAGEHLTGSEMAAAFGEALGEPVNYVAMAHDDYRALGFPGADDLGNMFQYKVLCNREFRQARDLKLSRKLNPDLMSFRAWLVDNASRIPASGISRG